MFDRWFRRPTPETSEEILTPSTPSQYILTDIAANAVLALSAFPPVVTFLNECTLDSAVRQHVNLPNYHDSFFLKSLEPEQYPEWSWVHKERIFVPTRPDLVTDHLRTRSKLAVAKGRIIASIMHNLNTVRSKFNTGISFQETLYLAKYLQAKEFKATGYDESKALEYPHVLQYADFMRFSLREAADEILLKARIAHDEMAKTEFIRMKFFKKVKEAESPEALVLIKEEFSRDLYITATL